MKKNEYFRKLINGRCTDGHLLAFFPSWPETR